jgi:N-acetylneuraminic acid mutarotase
MESLESRQLLHGVLPVTINFQPANAPVPGGTIPDVGLVYGTRDAGFEFGWKTDTTANAVDRNSSFTSYQRLDTFIDMQKGGARTWEMDIHPGKYKVTVGGGDSGAWGHTIAIAAEGKTVVKGTTTSSTRFYSGTLTLDIVDGHLTLTNASGALNNKINYVSIAYVGAASTPTPTPPPDNTPPPTSTGTITWTQKASIPTAKSECFSATIGNKVYVFGGYIDSTYHPSTGAHVYDAATNKWSSIKSLPVALSHAGTATDGQYIYFAGGYPGTGTNGAQKFSTTDVRRYDPVTNTYLSLPALPSARGAGAAAILGRTLYFMGGADSNRVDRTEVWSLNLDNTAAGWTQRASLPAARNHPAAAALNGSLYFIGGQTLQDTSSTPRSDVFRYDPAANAWTTVAPLLPGRSHITSSTFTMNGRIISMGGETTQNHTLRNVDAYDPTSNTWSTIGLIPSGRASGVGTLLASGDLFFSAGYTGGAFSGLSWIGKIS